MALDIELAHIAHPAVDLHGQVADPVAHLGGIVFGHRGQRFGQAGSQLLLLAQGGVGGGILAGLALVSLEQVHPAPGLAEQGARRLDLAAHRHQHARHRGQLADGLVELAALLGIAVGLAVSRFGNPHRLGAHRQPGAVHQRHGVAQQPKTPLAQQLCGGIHVLHLAGGRGVEAHLVLDAPDAHRVIALDDEQRQAAGIRRAGLAARQHHVHIGAAVGNEALDAVQLPLAGGFIERGAGLHRAQV